MTHHKLITAVGIWKPAMRKFTEEVNVALNNGWDLDEPVEPIFFGMFGRKYLLVAHLSKTDPPFNEQ